MNLEKQYMELKKIKKEINERLIFLDYDKVKELIIWFTKNEMYIKLKHKDNQLCMLSNFIDIWLKEKKYQDSFAMQGDIFMNVNSLEMIERKYNIIKFTTFRIEANMPYEYCDEGICEIIKQQVSAYALLRIVMLEVNEKEKVILNLARILREKNELLKAIGLLEKAVEEYSENADLILELAYSWVDACKIEKAYGVLKTFKKPNEQINKLILELEKVLEHEEL